MDQKFKIFRRIFSSLFFLLLTYSLLFTVSISLYDHIISSQPGPSILKLSSGGKFILLSGTVLLGILIVFLGRSFCSLSCPLGYLQDIFIHLGKIAGVKSRRKISKMRKAKILRLTLLLIIVVLFITGNGFLPGIIEPFSIYSRSLFLLSQGSDIHKLINIGSLSIVFTLLPVLAILLLSLKLGRYFCYWICPVGTILWGLSYISIFKLKINKSKCTSCGKCIENCKAYAIEKNTLEIDSAFCTGCFNCLYTCNTGAVGIGKNQGISKVKSQEIKETGGRMDNSKNRRSFLKQLASMIFFLLVPVNFPRLNIVTVNNNSVNKRHPAFPPGSEDDRHFIQYCTGCMVCAGKCPSKIINPSMGYSGSSPLLPVLNFQNGYCLEDCIECTQVCPTGALNKLTVGEKKGTKIADLELNPDKCIIRTDSLECNVCAEICPVNAIKMIFQPEGSFPLPSVVQEVCTGCGKCLYRCPAKERTSIFKLSATGN